MRGKEGQGALIRNPRRFDDCDMYAMEDARRGLDHRVMRSGKAENAVRAAGLIGAAGRLVRHGLVVVEAKFKGRRVVTRLRRQREGAKRDQHGLRGDSVGDNDARQRPPKALWPIAHFE